MKKIFVVLSFLWLYLNSFSQIKNVSQTDSTGATFAWSGYIETYYAFDFNNPESGNRPSFVYSFNRHNEFNINLGYLKGTYSSDKLRANMAIMTGTYANANLASEPGVLRNIFEANVGIKLSPIKNIWLDAGIFASHIGFESAVGKDSWNLTRSILADNTPYYESGVKLTYGTDNEKWILTGLVLNGWQRIQRYPGNSLPSFGTQIIYKPTQSVLLNSSTFIGTDSPDSARVMRYFHNFYTIIQVNNRLGLTVGFDYGIQQAAPSASSYNSWLSPIIIARLTLTDRASMDFRAEYYQDENGIIIDTDTPNGFKTTGLSTNFDYKISDHALWRIEIRNFISKDAIFVREDEMVKDNTVITTSLSINF
ncbi:MAG TPA: porin [Cyclobacteriaceae bacterium]|nr:porin [Cyclobacteriaceae bacterium]